MIHMTECTHGKTKGTIMWTFWNHLYTKQFDLDLNKDEAHKFLRKKKVIEHVSWMHVLSISDKRKKIGTYAETVLKLRDLQ